MNDTSTNALAPAITSIANQNRYSIGIPCDQLARPGQKQTGYFPKPRSRGPERKRKYPGTRERFQKTDIIDWTKSHDYREKRNSITPNRPRLPGDGRPIALVRCVTNTAMTAQTVVPAATAISGGFLRILEESLIPTSIMGLSIT